MDEMTGAAQAKVGDELPPFTRMTGFHNWNRYAAVNDEFVPIHMDDEAGRGAGYPTAFGMGNLQWAFLHNLLREWLGDHGRIVGGAFQFRAPTIKDMTVTAKGIIPQRRTDNGTQLIDLDVWTEDQDGNSMAPGTATIALN